MLGQENQSASSETTSIEVTEHEVADAGDEPNDEPWWLTPSSDYRPTVAVDPSIYGIEPDHDDVIANGTNGQASALPFVDAIQAAFGPRHDLGGATAHTGRDATSAADAVGANAFASGSSVVFGQTPDLWTAAHEATHLVQQNAGVRPAGGIGADGDEHEQRADAVADLVVRGDSAQPLLADYAPFAGALAAPAGSMLQLDRKTDTKRPASAPPPRVSDAGAFAFLKEGEQAIVKFEQGAQRANALYEVVKKQATMKATHERIDANYKEVSKQRDKMLEVSTFEKILGGVTALIDFATSVSSVIAAARTLQAAAALHALDKKAIVGELIPSDKLRATKLRKGKGSNLKAAGDLVKDGIDVGKGVADVVGGDDPDAKVDTDTMLPNANAAAIAAGNDALIGWLNASNDLNFLMLKESGTDATQKFHHMAEGVALLVKGGTPLSESSFERYKSIIERFDTARLEYVAAVQRMASLLNAYNAGGGAGLADPTELSVFETIQEWKANNDPKAKALRFSLDQDAKSILFDGLHVDVAGTIGGIVTNYYCHRYEEITHRSEDATLYVSDGAAMSELRKLGLEPAINNRHGESEKAEDKPGGGLKLAISASIAKAIESLGVPGTSNNARVQFLTNGGAPLGEVSSKQKGPWFENWRSTPEFTAFWRTHLGGRYGYLMPSDGKRQTIPAAQADNDVMARSSFSTGAGGAM